MFDTSVQLQLLSEMSASGLFRLSVSLAGGFEEKGRYGSK